MNTYEQTMTDAVYAWMAEFLDKHAADAKGRTGRLRIYMDRNRVPNLPNCISLDRLVAHLHVAADIVKKAVIAFGPDAGTGKNIHVVLTSDARRQRDKEDARAAVMAARDEQTAFRLSLYRDAGIEMSQALPSFTMPDVSGSVN